jgi:hypothetical protein
MGADDFGAVEEWYSASGPALQACPACQSSYVVTDWSFEPDFALGNLAFTFWSVPPMSPRLVEEVARLLAPHRVVAVSGRI